MLVVLALACVSIAGCAVRHDDPAQDEAPQTAADSTATTPTTVLYDTFRDTDLGCGWEPTGSMKLSYAQCFTIDEYAGGYRLACLADGNRYLIVPEGKEPPDGLKSDVTVIRQPVGDVYLVASDTMCLFEALDALDCITVSGIERDDWHSTAAREAMDAGDIVYGGKYRMPDYELLVSRGVRLAVESTMINHTPDVREKLIELGIPVLVELSSYESEPLGRAEWVRLYGVLLGKERQASEVFEGQVSRTASLREVSTPQTVAFFYLNGSGAAVVRRPGDYVSKMIEQAGGISAFDQLEAAEVGASSVTLQMEQFYADARDADVLIYNASIDQSVDSIASLVERDELFADFAAVQSGNVWVSDQDMYQRMLESGGIIADLNHILCGETDDLTFFRRLS